MISNQNLPDPNPSVFYRSSLYSKYPVTKFLLNNLYSVYCLSMSSSNQNWKKEKNASQEYVILLIMTTDWLRLKVERDRIFNSWKWKCCNWFWKIFEITLRLINLSKTKLTSYCWLLKVRHYVTQILKALSNKYPDPSFLDGVKIIISTKKFQ